MIKAGFGTRIFYTSLDGFDTHANQLGTHAALLTELSDSIAALPRRPRGRGQADRVAVLTFSEFGRRVAGERFARDRPRRRRPGVPGRAGREGRTRRRHPSFDDLDDGDLKFHTDFRRVYAALLADWLDCPPQSVVGAGFPPLPLLRKA